MHDIEVRLLVPAANVVHIAQFAGFQHAADSAAVVLDVKPVTNLLAVSVNRQGLAGECIVDDERNELFGKVVGAVVVGAVGGQYRQAVGMVVGTDQMVTGCLAGGIRAVRLVAGWFP